MSESSFGIPGGGDASPNGSGYLPTGMESAPTGSEESNYQQMLDGAAERSRESTAQFLAERQAQKNAGQFESAQSVDLEVQLQNAQLELHNARKGNYSFAQIAQLEHRAQSLAEQLVTGQAGGSPSGFESSIDQSDDPQSGWDDHSQDIVDGIKNQYDWDANINYAAENLDRATVESLNDVLSDSSDEVALQATAQMLNAYRESDGAGFSQGEFNDLRSDDGAMRQLNERYGEQTAERIQLLGWAVATGKSSLGEAIKLASKDQTLLTSLMDAQQQGIINFHLGN